MQRVKREEKEKREKGGGRGETGKRDERGEAGGTKPTPLALSFSYMASAAFLKEGAGGGGKS